MSEERTIIKYTLIDKDGKEAPHEYESFQSAKGAATMTPVLGLLAVIERKYVLKERRVVWQPDDEPWPNQPIALTPNELHVLRHALGLDRSGRPYRNHYVCPLTENSGLDNRDVVYHVTRAGAKAAGWDRELP